jgi:hypothetical protein
LLGQSKLESTFRSLGTQDAAGVEVGVTAFGGCVPSDLWRFLPLAVFLTCFAEIVLLPTRFFFASAMSILLSKDAEDTCGMDAQACSCSPGRIPTPLLEEAEVHRAIDERSLR